LPERKCQSDSGTRVRPKKKGQTMGATEGQEGKEREGLEVGLGGNLPSGDKEEAYFGTRNPLRCRTSSFGKKGKGFWGQLRLDILRGTSTKRGTLGRLSQATSRTGFPGRIAQLSLQGCPPGKRENLKDTLGEVRNWPLGLLLA